MKSIFSPLKLTLIGLLFLFSACTKQNLEKTQSPLSAVNSQQDLLSLNGGNSPEYIPGSYIVVFKEGNVRKIDDDADELESEHGFKTERRFKSAIKGFSGKLSDAAVASLRNDARVAYVEQDQVAHMIGVQSPVPSWGLNRVDQPSLPLDQNYNYSQDGTGVDAYIIDCGILLSHTDFGGRAHTGFDAITTGGAAIDANGHGTHVAGTVGGTAYGIAKNVNLIAVRVLDATGSGTYSQVIAGIDFVTSDHASHPSRPAVANMSLGGGVSAALDDAVKRSIASGVTYCIAAGNSAANASTSSPADVVDAITVGASDVTDKFASFSNYGTLVDIIAPGVNITSDWFSSTTATNTISGTSMATPHVTGVVALYLQENPSATTAQIQAAIINNSYPNKITGVPTGTTTKLLSSVVGTLPALPSIPNSPVLVSPTNAAIGISATPSVSLSWNASSGASSYSVQLSTSASFATIALSATGITGTSLAVTGLAGNTVYYWRVAATNLGGTSSYSSANSFSTAVIITKPTTPVLTSPLNAATGIAIPTTLTWNKVTGATSYSVQVSKTNTFTTSSLVYNVTGLTANASSVSGLVTKTKYYWRVNATNSAGTSSWSSSTRSFTTQ